MSPKLKSIYKAVEDLSMSEKLELFEHIFTMIEQAEEDLFEKDKDFQQQIREARAAYQAKQYTTLDDYLSQDNQ